MELYRNKSKLFLKIDEQEWQFIAVKLTYNIDIYSLPSILYQLIFQLQKFQYV